MGGSWPGLRLVTLAVGVPVDGQCLAELDVQPGSPLGHLERADEIVKAQLYADGAILNQSTKKKTK